LGEHQSAGSSAWLRKLKAEVVEDRTGLLLRDLAQGFQRALRSPYFLRIQRKIPFPEGDSLLYMDAVGVVVVGHVGEDDLVPFFESIEDFDRIYGRAAELDVEALPFATVLDEFE
jgi:hypothetical protein